MTDVDINALMQLEMDLAIDQKRRLDADKDDDFKMRVVVIGPGGSVADLPLEWTSMADKRIKMAVLSMLCKSVSAKAVIIATDSRSLKSDDFCKYFNIQYSDAATFHAEYDRIMAGYNYEMSRLPRETWEEALNVFGYGPGIKKMMLTRYSVADHAFVFEPTVSAPETDDLEIGLIPAWWD